MTELFPDSVWMKGACMLVFMAGSIFFLMLHIFRSRKPPGSLILQVDTDHDIRLSKGCETYCAYLISYLESLSQYHHLSRAHSEVLHGNITLLEKIVKSGYPSVCSLDEQGSVERKEAQFPDPLNGGEQKRNVEAEFRDLMLRVTLNPFERLPGRV